jgi:hypothetical protein
MASPPLHDAPQEPIDGWRGRAGNAVVALFVLPWALLCVSLAAQGLLAALGVGPMARPSVGQKVPMDVLDYLGISTLFSAFGVVLVPVFIDATRRAVTGRRNRPVMPAKLALLALLILATLLVVGLARKIVLALGAS